MKVKFISAAGSSIVQLPDTFPLTSNFKLKEMANNQGDPKEAQYIISERSTLFMKAFQRFRTIYNTPIDPTSGYRQPAFNAKVGGDPNSAHLGAEACDWIDKRRNDPFFIFGSWISILDQLQEIGAVNLYRDGSYYRYHMETGSAARFGYKKSRIRIYTNRADYEKYKAIYTPIGLEVTYNGNK